MSTYTQTVHFTTVTKFVYLKGKFIRKSLQKHTIQHILYTQEEIKCIGI